ncbi:UdgX family uracil-DNA binding protein [Acuticoccus sp. I52.16.1]|uniref:UdgX family uracil-DNA binding protein n=1 Tax=Acuticoccus sp. I52.16.1 TaxID=2928472 RepID=UPI001FD12564|nr:UdgX family uracil-DNA binding protein [Acuticoccus sp. I52.16.1]UOM33656.1 UdgX family uracil-DNA binding protein [Acuticoccus sp. I52.16.1]
MTAAALARAERTPRWTVTLDHPADFATFRAAARKLTAGCVPARDVDWVVGEVPRSLFGADRHVDELPEPAPVDAPRAPRDFPALAEALVCHRAPERFVLAHRLLERFAAEPKLLEIASDPDVAKARTMAKNVARCSHKMKAFVRFRETHDADGIARFVAWFEPEHHTLDRTAPFFMRRFPEMRWSILTPDRSAHWDGEILATGPGAARDVAPGGDVNEELWRTYFGAIFNPARLKVKAMQSEMPKRYWKNMPEAALITPLIQAAGRRTEAMVAAPTRTPARSTRVARERRAQDDAGAAAAADIATLADLARAATHCTRCPLYGPATQVVVGEGRPGAPIMFVGEQPGDQEDLAGRPFVGPAGRLFDEALAAAGIDRAQTFITNAVKHFRFTPRGKRRIHQKPTLSQVHACGVWLEAERDLVRPRLTVALGATAAQALMGRAVSIGRERGRALAWANGDHGLITIHPSYLLRLPDPDAKRSEFEQFVADLSRVRELGMAYPPER